MVEKYADLFVGAPFVAERVLHHGLFAGRGACKVVVAHGKGDVPFDFNLVVVEDAVRPPFAALVEG